MIQHFLNRTGLRIKIREMEWSALKAATIKGKFDMCYLTWHADYPEAENFLFPLFFSVNRGSGGNRSFYKNARVDQLLIKAQRTINTEKRFDIYHTVERLITDDAPWIFLWYGDKKIILSKRVRKFVPYQIYNGMKGNEITMY
jgi:ABC-type oligopeptide transport system substrate-binding subunit